MVINMADYTKVTRDGYEVKRLYQVKKNKDSNPFLYAILRRPTEHPYIIAWNYNPRDGYWDDGSYDWDTIAECERHIKKNYRTARPVSSNGLIWLKSDYMVNDGFGWYTTDDQKQLFSNAYRISKSRGNTLQFIVPTGRMIGYIRWHATHKMSIYKPSIGKYLYRVYADGRIERDEKLKW